MNKISIAKAEYYGYQKSFIYNDEDLLFLDNYELLDITKNNLLYLLKLETSPDFLLYDTESVIFYKVLEDVTIDFNVIKSALNKIINEELSFDTIKDYLYILLDENAHFIEHIHPFNEFKSMKKEYFLKNEIQIVMNGLIALNQAINPYNYIEKIKGILNIIDNLLKGEYKEENTIKFLLNYLLANDKEFKNNKEAIDFFNELLNLLDDEDYFKLQLLADAYNEGNAFIDVNKDIGIAYALQAFIAKKDTHLANFIADYYINYAPKCSKTDVGFLCANYSYLNDQNTQATLLLSKCYKEGIGTFSDVTISYNILKEGYFKAFKDLIEKSIFDNYFVQLAKTMAKYLNDGYGQEVDRLSAKEIASEVLFILKEKNNKKELNDFYEEYLINYYDEIERVIENDGYDVTSNTRSLVVRDAECVVELNDNLLYIDLTLKNDGLLHFYFEDIDLLEFTNHARFIVEIDENEIREDDVVQINSEPTRCFFFGKEINFMCKDGSLTVTTKKTYYIPEFIKDLNKKYRIALINLKNKIKLIEVNKNIDVGDTIIYLNKEYIIQEIFELYEDKYVDILKKIN